MDYRKAITVKFKIYTMYKDALDPFLHARLKNGCIMPWQCLSVCPSVRPSVFMDFSSTCFEISIWNLVYTISRWHDMSSLSCITIGSLWHSLQPKAGQTYFGQSWPQKSRLILQIWYICGLLYTKVCFLCKYCFWNFGNYFCMFKIFQNFSTCFETWIRNLVYKWSRWCYTSSLSFIPIGSLWPTLQTKIDQSCLSVFMALKIIQSIYNPNVVIDLLWHDVTCLNFGANALQVTKLNKIKLHYILIFELMSRYLCSFLATLSQQAEYRYLTLMKMCSYDFILKWITYGEIYVHEHAKPVCMYLWKTVYYHI